MIPSMTEDKGRRTQIVQVNGRSIVIRELTKLQLLRIGVYVSIAASNNVADAQKMEATGKLANILHKVIVQPDDLAWLIECEDNGDIELDELMGFISAFNEEDADSKPVVRRSRAKR
jgi:hypothetical protein